MRIYHWPSNKENITLIIAMAVFLLITITFIGIRPEHLYLIGGYLILFYGGLSTRKLAVALIPFIIFGVSYDWMRIYPNYMVNPIDVERLYNLEKTVFGMTYNGQLITPCEYFTIHHSSLADFFAGIFYLCWVPVPIAFGIWLYATKARSLYLRFSLVFLLVNLIGFVGYYIHPAAPPWYAINYGMEPVLGTPGNAAGLARFDTVTGLTIFNSMYGRNANVFAAVPSLHAAYMVIPLFYAVLHRCKWYIITLFSVIMVGIWATAVYSSHHYIIDVILGILCAISGLFIFEKGLMKSRIFKLFFEKYDQYIK